MSTIYDTIYEELEDLNEIICIEDYNDNYDNMCSIFLYPLSEQTITFDNSMIRRMGLQIRVRDVNQVNAYSRSIAIFNVFKKYKNGDLIITSKSDIVSQPKDKHDRTIYTINFNLKIIENN